MKLTKRLICLAVALMLTFALCACGEKEEKKENDGTTTTQSTTTTTKDDWASNLEGDNQFNDAQFGEW